MADVLIGFSRDEMAKLRDRAEGHVQQSSNPRWTRAFKRLAEVTDQLEAMYARAELVELLNTMDP